jgi:hypothetical protein
VVKAGDCFCPVGLSAKNEITDVAVEALWLEPRTALSIVILDGFHVASTSAVPDHLAEAGGDLISYFTALSADSPGPKAELMIAMAEPAAE